MNEDEYIKHIRAYYYSEDRQWYELYNFIEYIVGSSSGATIDKNTRDINSILKEEMSAYRFVEGRLIQITSEEEIQSIEESINITTDKYKPVNTYLKSALTLLSDREIPDYRNSVKESISSVESLCKILVGNEKARLSQAIKLLKEKHSAHPALLDSFEKLYGYTSDSGGIRHSLTEDGKEVDFHDAKFMLVTCSAFINYMIGKSE